MVSILYGVFVGIGAIFGTTNINPSITARLNSDLSSYTRDYIVHTCEFNDTWTQENETDSVNYTFYTYIDTTLANKSLDELNDDNCYYLETTSYTEVMHESIGDDIDCYISINQVYRTSDILDLISMNNDDYTSLVFHIGIEYESTISAVPNRVFYQYGSVVNQSWLYGADSTGDYWLDDYYNYYKDLYDDLKITYDDLQLTYNQLVQNYNDLQDLYNDYLNGNVSFTALIWTIATTPFETFKTIWNVDLLGVNLGGLCVSLMFVGLVLWIWKKFI